MSRRFAISISSGGKEMSENEAEEKLIWRPCGTEEPEDCPRFEELQHSKLGIWGHYEPAEEKR